MKLNAGLKNSFVKGALTVSLGGLIAKLLGALYRIPLTNILKADGLGVYQTVFPVYALLLTFSSSGVPSAISKLVSSGEDGEKILARALSFFMPLGLVGTIILCLLSVPLSALQGAPEAKFAYIALSPSVFFVSAIACVRGYFQGKSDMSPTAFSQIIEQTAKLVFGLALCFVFRADYAVAGAAACFAVTLSEICACLYLTARLKKSGVTAKRSCGAYSLRKIIAVVAPITLSALLLPIARAFDSFTIVNIIGEYSSRATALYGIYTGGVESVVGVPVAICYGAAVSALPAISAATAIGDHGTAKRKTVEAIGLTAFTAAIFAASIAIFARTITRILFGGLGAEDAAITAGLLSFSGINVFLLALTQTLTSILVGYGKPYASCVFLGAGILAKAASEIVLLKIPSINVFGALYSDILCYLIAIFGDLVYIIYITKKAKRQSADKTR